MKTNTFIMILLAIMISASQSLAQTFIDRNSYTYFGDFEAISLKLNYQDISGSPYLNDDLVLGQVVFNSGDSIAYYLRYDMYADEMEYLNKNNKSLNVAVNIPALDHIYLDGHRFVSKSYFENGKQSSGFLVQLVSGQCSLYKSVRVKFEEAQAEQSMPFREATPEQFKSTPAKWYFGYDSSTITSFNPSNAGLKQVFEKHYTKVKDFIKANRLKPKKEEDLITLFEYYNELLKQ